MPQSTLSVASGVSLGTLLRQFRRAAGLSQEALAARATVSGRTLSNIERGAIRTPQVDTLRLIADALDLRHEDRMRLDMALRGGKAMAAPPATSPPAHLPASLVPLIGRGREFAAVTSLLRREGVRLVTLIGTGGVGKTRLALAVAAALRGEFTDGVFFVSLAPVRDPELYLPAMAQILGVQIRTQTPFEALCTYLRERRVLLVLDNFEQLLSEAVPLANLLAACTGVHVLATSRAPLRIRGEHEYPLAPLAVLTVAQWDHLALVSQSPAVKLFGHYARAVRPSYRLAAHNAAVAAALCTHLDSLPLALELAAARTRHFTPEALLARLTPRLPELTDGARDAPLRQQALRDTIAWSYDLLGEEEQRLFARVAVFASGATEAAIIAVDGSGAVRRVEALADQSLLTVTPDTEGAPRYGMLETVREFAWDRLADWGAVDETRRRHAEYVLAVAEEARPHLGGREQVQWMARLRAEHDNARVALQWARDTRAAETGLRIAVALTGYWKDQGHIREGWEWLQSLLGLDEEAGTCDETVRAQGLVSAGDLAHRRADYDTAVTLITEGLALARKIGDERTVARALHKPDDVPTPRRDIGGGQCVALPRRGRTLQVSAKDGNTRDDALQAPTPSTAPPH